MKELNYGTAAAERSGPDTDGLPPRGAPEQQPAPRTGEAVGKQPAAANSPRGEGPEAEPPRAGMEPCGTATGSACDRLHEEGEQRLPRAGKTPVKRRDASRMSGEELSPAAATGRRGEEIAAEWLRHAGYEICDRNWRRGSYELDIVARKGEYLHFVEVKTRRADALTPPEQALTPLKCRALLRAAALYMELHACAEEPRFDLAAVDMLPDGGAAVRFIPDAVESHW